jgi:hypothetical protein
LSVIGDGRRARVEVCVGGTQPTLTALGRGFALASVGHGRFDGIDQGRDGVMDRDHADAERCGIVTLRVP